MNNDHTTPLPESETDNAPEGQAPEGRTPAASSVSRPAGGGQNAGWGTPSSAAGSAFPPTAGWGSPRQHGGWDAPAGRSKPWTIKRGVVVAGAAAVLAGGAGVGIYALTTSSAAADGTADAGALQETLPGSRGGAQGGFADGGMPPQGGPGNFAPEGLGGMGSGVSAAVHSEYVILQDGAYVTKVEQQGTVTEVSSGAVTVKSADGFSRTYSLDSDVAVSNQQQRRQQAGGTSASTLTVADIVSGAMVRIVAAKDGDSFPAESVQLVAATLTGQSN
ncbi:hypothetical protein [Arthrobacter sp. Leaf337]|uniref:hypothetical protein n=1 Tax=Arthrobacter sp. Leaf337 TaxID=1736342 RepID=UPI000A60D25E|nr:hypothetical protein [Arthrobacter sp. Leaf337]